MLLDKYTYKYFTHSVHCFSTCGFPKTVSKYVQKLCFTEKTKMRNIMRVVPDTSKPNSWKKVQIQQFIIGFNGLFLRGAFFHVLYHLQIPKRVERHIKMFYY